MRCLFAFCSGIILVLASCRKSSTNENGEVMLNQCTEKKFSNEQVFLCFDSVLADSRCPIHYACIWGGYALGKFTFKEGGHLHDVRLSTSTIPGIPSQDTTIAGYTIRLLNILPYPGDVPSPTRAQIEITK